MKNIWLILFLLLPILSRGQQDTLVMTYQQYIESVLEHHPLMFQAALLDEKSKAYRLKAKGYFDPKIEFNFASKDFDKKDYYQLINGALKVPTWLGVDVKVAYENNRGQFLDNSDKLPQTGLIAAGIEVSLGRGLLFDERRKAIRDAELFRQGNEIKQQLLISDLLFEAILAYANWQHAFNVGFIKKEGLGFATRRFENVKESYLNGDKPAIDTLESFIALQVRNTELIKAQQNYNNSVQGLNNFMWVEGKLPMELEGFVIPESINLSAFKSQMDSISLTRDQILRSHPELLKYKIVEEELRLDQRLNRENLKPVLNLGYNPLIRTDADNSINALVTENYKLGLDFAYPIFTRKERAAIKLTDIQLQENEIQRLLKGQSIQVKLNALIDNEQFYIQQTDLLKETADNYLRLLEAEYLKLGIGESSVFLVNAREIKYLEYREKLIEAQMKLIANRVKVINEVALVLW